MTPRSLLSLRGLTKRYGALPALEAVDLDVVAGSRCAIVGPSGSGKTTLLRIVAGFEEPDAGSVRLGDRMLANGPVIVAAHLRGIGYVPQDGALFPHLSVADNIGFGLPSRAPGRDMRIDELMDMVSLDSAMRDRRPHELSGGQQQRVALARALAQRPGLMLLDEPFSALDTGLRAATRKAVAQVLGRAGVTTILVTHDQAEALSFADQVAVMRAGRLVQVGSPQDVYQRPADPAAALFMGDALVMSGICADGRIDCMIGSVRCDASVRSGAVQLMLRPEQIDIAPLEEQASIDSSGFSDGADGQLAVLLENDFGGSECELLLQLLGGPAKGERLRLRMHSDRIPPVGSRVVLRATGMAHVFDSAQAGTDPDRDMS